MTQEQIAQIARFHKNQIDELYKSLRNMKHDEETESESALVAQKETPPLPAWRGSTQKI